MVDLRKYPKDEQVQSSLKSNREEVPTQLRGYQRKGWNQVREGAQKDYIKRSFQASI